jgi:glutamyl/glutaminyl-tRNA synthetase
MMIAFPPTSAPTRAIAATLTRFAPAPTGSLHLGHVLNALYVWNTARLLGCRVLLRIEDHDRERSRPAFERGILDDLDWLGFAPDIYPTDAFRQGRCDGRQSDRDHVYRAAVEQLLRLDAVYACECTRRTLAPSTRVARSGQASGPAIASGQELRYPGTCRDKRLPLVDGYGWRVRMDDRLEHFDDGLLGPQTQRPGEQYGDVLIRDRRGNWTYQFAVTVDDLSQQVDLVIRGIDLLQSTGRQIQLARLLGRRVPPAYLHHPLIMKSPDQKLSKSDGDTGIAALASAGWSRERILDEAASRIDPQ